MTEIDIFHTHLYPGARGRAPEGDGDVLLRFSDGMSAAARLRGGRLDVEPYRTAAGTGIAAKFWRVKISDGGFRVVTRLE